MPELWPILEKAPSVNHSLLAPCNEFPSQPASHPGCAAGPARTSPPPPRTAAPCAGGCPPPSAAARLPTACSPAAGWGRPLRPGHSKRFTSMPRGLPWSTDNWRPSDHAMGVLWAHHHGRHRVGTESRCRLRHPHLYAGHCVSAHAGATMQEQRVLSIPSLMRCTSRQQGAAMRSRLRTSSWVLYVTNLLW